MGTGNATPAVASLDAPAATASAGAKIITLKWSKTSPPGAGTVRYYVTRTGGAAPKSNCPTSAATAETEKEFTEKQGGRTCTDEGLVAGETRHYTVTAIWRTWSGTGTEVSATATGAVAKFAETLTIAAAGPAESTEETGLRTHGGKGTYTLLAKRSTGTEFKQAEAKLTY